MAEVAIINASPLILLARGGCADLLPRFFKHVLIPRQVADEILVHGDLDVTVSVMRQAEWLEIINVGPIPRSIEMWGLGAGESSVIALSMEMGRAEVIIDDLAGRRCALSNNVPVRGTLGIVLLAKQKGFIPAARPVLEDLIRGGLYLSRHVLNSALARVGE